MRFVERRETPLIEVEFHVRVELKGYPSCVALESRQRCKYTFPGDLKHTHLLLQRNKSFWVARCEEEEFHSRCAFNLNRTKVAVLSCVLFVLEMRSFVLSPLQF